MESAHSVSRFLFRERTGRALKKLVLTFVIWSGFGYNVEEQMYVNVICTLFTSFI